jgi:hypothetical protein
LIDFLGGLGHGVLEEGPNISMIFTDRRSCNVRVDLLNVRRVFPSNPDKLPTPRKKSIVYTVNPVKLIRV